MQRLLQRPIRLTATNVGGSPTDVAAKSAFAKRLRELEEEQGLPPHRLGKAAGLSPFTISKWLGQADKGVEYPGTLAHVMKLLKYYGRTITWLLSEPEEQPTGISFPQVRAVVAALVDLDGVPHEEASGIVTSITSSPATELELYRIARLKLRNSPESSLPPPPDLTSPGVGKAKKTFADEALNVGKSGAAKRPRNARKER